MVKYNTNKGENTFGESEILEPLHTCLRELLERDRTGSSLDIKYTDDDVVAATLMYAHILGNRLIHNLTEEKAGIALAQELTKHYSVLINEVTLGMSKVDTSVYYKGRGNK